MVGRERQRLDGYFQSLLGQSIAVERKKSSEPPYVTGTGGRTHQGLTSTRLGTVLCRHFTRDEYWFRKKVESAIGDWLRKKATRLDRIYRGNDPARITIEARKTQGDEKRRDDDVDGYVPFGVWIRYDVGSTKGTREKGKGQERPDDKKPHSNLPVMKFENGRTVVKGKMWGDKIAEQRHAMRTDVVLISYLETSLEPEPPPSLLLLMPQETRIHLWRALGYRYGSNLGRRRCCC